MSSSLAIPQAIPSPTRTQTPMVVIPEAKPASMSPGSHSRGSR